MTRLPIFRLPQLVYIKIINSMNPAEQFLTALCSRKAYSLVKNHRSKVINLCLGIEPYRVSITDEQKMIYKTLKLYIDKEPSSDSKKREKSIDINENRGLKCSIDNQDDHDSLETCWKDQSVGLKKMLELATDLFCIVRIDSAHITGPENIWIVDWLKEQKITLEELYFHDRHERITDEGIKHVILNCPAQQLRLYRRPTSNFQIQNFSKTFGLFACYLDSAFWITIGNLIALDCIDLQIFGKYFTTQEVNRFLKHWIKGGSSRLKFLRIGVEEYSQDEVFADIQNYVTRVPGDGFYTSPYHSQFTFNGLQLRRNDGVIASIQYPTGANSLYLGVWPDANGNEL